jgi:hypothetical protein
MSLRFEAEAAEEFLGAIEYYENQSAGLGAELLADVELPWRSTPECRTL